MPSAYTIKDIEPRIDHMGTPVWYSRSSGVAYKRNFENDELGSALHEDIGKAGGVPENKVLAPPAAPPSDILTGGKEVPADHAPMRKFADLQMPAGKGTPAAGRPTGGNAKLAPIKKKKPLTEDNIEELDLNPWDASFTQPKH